jgi:hypothetical protein
MPPAEVRDAKKEMCDQFGEVHLQHCTGQSSAGPC